ncbi:MAG: hypothetical protein R3B70_40050 [Polyangiaceae bacterium]
MRSRPDLTVLLRPGAPLPGTVLEVEARFESHSETPVDGVILELTGVERFAVPRGKSQLVRTHSHVHLRSEQPGGVFEPGTHTYHARFQLPNELPPRYSGRFGSVDYTLSVRASIPWWPDAVGRYDVPIALLSRPVPPSPGVFVSRAGGVVGGEIYAELSLASTVVAPGGELVGTVAFTNAHKERGVRVSLVAYEHLFADGDFWSGGRVDEMHEVRRWSFSPAAGGVPPDGAPLPFRFAVAKDAVPSFTGALSELLWVVEVSATGLISSRELIRAPITILPQLASRPPSSAAVPAVGLARRALTFQTVARDLRLAFDESTREIHGGTGAVSVRVGVATRPDGELVTVAKLAWPSLGMGLLLAPGSWMDPFRSREIKIGVGPFDDRFHIESRFPEQARALLDPQLCEHLMSFDEVRADDAGAALAVPMAISEVQPLAHFTARALATARALDAAMARVPLPPALAPHAEAWQAAAARMGGRLEPGRPAILEATYGLERVEIATTWTSEATLDATEITLPLGARVDPDALSPAARALLTSLETSAQHVSLTSETLTLRLRRPTPDPADLDPLIETLVRLAQLVRGRGAAGPFRS